MKYTDLAKLLTNKNLDDVIRWQCPCQMILEDEQDFCTDCGIKVNPFVKTLFLKN